MTRQNMCRLLGKPLDRQCLLLASGIRPLFVDIKLAIFYDRLLTSNGILEVKELKYKNSGAQLFCR